MKTWLSTALSAARQARLPNMRRRLLAGIVIAACVALLAAAPSTLAARQQMAGSGGAALSLAASVGTEGQRSGLQAADVAGVVIAPTSLDLPNGAAVRSYTVGLATMPSAGTVTVQVTFDATLLTVNGGASPLALAFADTTPQTLTVAGQADAFTGSYDTTLITHTILASDAPEYPVDMLVDSVVVGLGVPNPLAKYPPQPPAPRCVGENFFPRSPVRASMPDSYSQAVYCRLLVVNGRYLNWFGAPLTHAGNIGAEGVVALTLLQAVDVFSPTGITQFEGGAVVCLRGQGRMLLLNASPAPRVPQEVGTFQVQEFPGFSCVVLHEPATLALAQVITPPTTPPEPDPTPAFPTVTGLGAPLADCMVRTDVRVQLYAGPGTETEIIRLVPYNATLTAFERAGDWFLVDFNGTPGWLSGDLVTPLGACGP